MRRRKRRRRAVVAVVTVDRRPCRHCRRIIIILLAIFFFLLRGGGADGAAYGFGQQFSLVCISLSLFLFKTFLLFWRDVMIAKSWNNNNNAAACCKQRVKMCLGVLGRRPKQQH